MGNIMPISHIYIYIFLLYVFNDVYCIVVMALESVVNDWQIYSTQLFTSPDTLLGKHFQLQYRRRVAELKQNFRVFLQPTRTMIHGIRSTPVVTSAKKKLLQFCNFIQYVFVVFDTNIFLILCTYMIEATRAHCLYNMLIKSNAFTQQQQQQQQQETIIAPSLGKHIIIYIYI